MIEKIKLRLTVLEGMNEPFARTESEKAVIKELKFLIKVLGQELNYLQRIANKCIKTKVE